MCTVHRAEVQARVVRTKTTEGDTHLLYAYAHKIQPKISKTKSDNNNNDADDVSRWRTHPFSFRINSFACIWATGINTIINNCNANSDQRFLSNTFQSNQSFYAAFLITHRCFSCMCDIEGKLVCGFTICTFWALTLSLLCRVDAREFNLTLSAEKELWKETWKISLWVICCMFSW